MTKPGTSSDAKRSPLLRIRESLGFQLAEVAAHCGWAPAYLRELEGASDVDDSVAMKLSDTYGIDVVRVLEGHEADLPPVGLRALLRAQAEVLDAESRFAIANAAAVASDASQLRKLLDEPLGWKAISQWFKHNPDYSHPRHGTPEVLAKQVRRGIKLADGPIRSVLLDVVAKLSIHVVTAELAPHIDAISFATSRTGGVIVLNRCGAHARNAFGRRVTLAHEVCHILFDRPKMRGFDDFCTVAKAGRTSLQDKRLSTFAELERRARAFAVYLLAPRDALRDAWEQLEGTPAPRRVRLLMEHFGMGYEAVRAHLDSCKLLAIDEPMARVETDVPPSWEERDPLPIARGEGLEAVPLSRRGDFTSLVMRAWRQGVISESGAREALRVELRHWPSARDQLLAGQQTGTASRWTTSSASLGLP